jgi:glycosyltransferase involved in cell wall biosynthesis
MKEENIRILFVTRETRYLPGANYRAYQFAKILSQERIKTSVLSYADHLGAKSGIEERDMNLVDKLRFNIKAFKKIRDFSPDLIFIQRFNYHSFSPYIVSILNHIPYIFDLDDWEFREDISFYGKIIPKSKAELLTHFVAKNALFCSAGSHFLYFYLKNLNKKTVFLPPAIDTSFFISNGQKDNSDIVKLSWIGTIFRKEDVANLKFLLKIYKKISADFENLFLEIVGDGIYLEEVRKFARKERIGKIIFRGWIPHNRIPNYLEDIDIGLLPLVNDNKFIKAKFPVKLIEYMAVGKPVVSHNKGEAVHIITNGEDSFLADRDEEFIERLILLIKDVNLRRKLGLKAREKIEKSYSHEAIKPLLLRLKNEVSKNSSC